MKKVQTKSGFVWNVDEKKAADWDFVCALVDCDDADGATRVKASRNVVIYLLGSDGAAALAEHVKDKNGIKPINKIMEEFKEILTLLGAETKKSDSSQE